MAENNKQQACLKSISTTLERVFQRLDAIKSEVVRLFELSESESVGLCSRDFKKLRPLLDAHLLDGKNKIQGTGVLLEPGVLQDSDMFIEWRQLGAQGKLAPLRLNFNHSSDYFYDYLKMSWFEKPRQTGKSVIAGPYVDLFGQDMYILTFSIPIHYSGKFVGIAGADMALSEFESMLMRELLSLDHEAMIVTEQGRVIAANTVKHMVGELAREPLLSPDTERMSLDIGRDGVHWSLLKMPTALLHRHLSYS